MREHITEQLPKFFQDLVVKEEIGRKKNKFGRSVRYHTTVRRQTVLGKVEEELDLRLRDEPPICETLKIKCLTEELQSIAVDLEGRILADAEGRSLGPIGAHPLRINQLSNKEIFRLLDDHFYV